MIACRLTYADGTVEMTDVNPACSDAELKNYFEGTTFDLSAYGQPDNPVKCIKCEVLREDSD